MITQSGSTSTMFDKIKKGQPIIVYWLDAITDTGWAEDGVVDEVKDCLMQTIGFFHSVTPNMVRLYGTMGTYSRGENDRFLIPLGCVVKVRKYPMPMKPKLEKASTDKHTAKSSDKPNDGSIG